MNIVQTKTPRSERLRQLTIDQLMALHGILSYAYYDERILKVELRREIQRRDKDETI